MRKEILYAIVGGIILGLIVAFGVYRINSTIYSKNKNISIDVPTPTPTSIDNSKLKVVLDKPEEDDVVISSLITVSGLTKPKTWLALSGESSDYLVMSDSSGAFSQDIDLAAGVNQIKVTAFENNGNESATRVLVIYSPNFQERKLATDSPIATTSAEASSTSEVRKKVAQDVANIVSHPKAYIGTVTDITDSTIEIKNNLGEIKQITTGSTTNNVTNAIGTNNKQVKVADIAIGDFIIAMGYIENNSVLGAQRILITNQITEPKLSLVLGKITSVTKKNIVVKNFADDKSETLTPDKYTDIKNNTSGKSVDTKFQSLSQDDSVIYIKESDVKGVENLRSVFVIPKI
jgi:hypothetical protein